ncbi:MAG: hypothetical protein LBM13_00285 [Candidatus Ancillula sp.]|jgi:hypothetical protein|nr:hypothetical protein [Candidatus Ancillula sp.]
MSKLEIRFYKNLERALKFAKERKDKVSQESWGEFIFLDHIDDTSSTDYYQTIKNSGDKITNAKGEESYRYPEAVIAVSDKNISIEKIKQFYDLAADEITDIYLYLVRK